jgi:SAM-dependent methyltransferase
LAPPLESSSRSSGCREEYDRRDLEAMSAGDNYRRWILDQFKPYLGKDVVEVGAGSGDFSKLLLEAGIRSLIAVEPAINMGPVLKTVLAPFKNATVLMEKLPDTAYFVEKRPDTIIYINVLEHIRADSEELRRAFRLLLPGGYMWVFVPALTWLYGTNDEAVGHYRRYEKVPLTRLVEDVGFELVKIRYLDFFGIIPWFLLFRILKQATVRGNQVAFYDRFCVPILRRLENSIRFPIGKNLLIVGRRPI